MANTNTQRVKLYRLNQKQLKRFKREYYLTDSEHVVIKSTIKELRK